MSKNLFLEFVSDFLGGVRVVGIQPGWATVPDQILFDGPLNTEFDPPQPTTLCVPVSILLESPEDAREAVLRKVQASQIALERTRNKAERPLERCCESDSR